MKANGNHHMVRRTADKLGRDAWGVGVRAGMRCARNVRACVSLIPFRGPGCTKCASWKLARR